MKKRIIFIFSILVFLNIIAWYVVYEVSEEKPLKVVFFDVGQGDSIFIETPGRYQILIDGGPDSTVLAKLSKEMPFYDRSIDLVILTHPEHDHIFGLLEVLRNYRVDNILWTGVVRDNPEWEEWIDLIKKEGARIEIAVSGERVVLANSYIDILYPNKPLKGEIHKSLNNTSIVCALKYNNISFLFTGDIERSVEEELAESGKNLKSDVLKVSHHGSKTSSAPLFLEKVLPLFAVISVGRDNKYHHPHPVTLANLKKFGIEVLRTDRDGSITFLSDGTKLIYQKEN